MRGPDGLKPSSRCQNGWTDSRRGREQHRATFQSGGDLRLGLVGGSSRLLLKRKPSSPSQLVRSGCSTCNEVALVYAKFPATKHLCRQTSAVAINSQRTGDRNHRSAGWFEGRTMFVQLLFARRTGDGDKLAHPGQRHDRYRGSGSQPLLLDLPRLRGGYRYYRADQYCIHHQARGQTLMPSRPQRRQRHIWAYHPAPNSSKPSCAVSSPQSRQKRRNRSGPSPERVTLRRARSDPDDQSPSAANQPCKRFRGSPPTGRLRCRIEARPTRSRI